MNHSGFFILIFVCCFLFFFIVIIHLLFFCLTPFCCCPCMYDSFMQLFWISFWNRSSTNYNTLLKGAYRPSIILFSRLWRKRVLCITHSITIYEEIKVFSCFINFLLSFSLQIFPLKLKYLHCYIAQCGNTEVQCYQVKSFSDVFSVATNICARLNKASSYEIQILLD